MTDLNCPHCRRERELADEQAPAPPSEPIGVPVVSPWSINPMHVVDVITDPEIL